MQSLQTPVQGTRMSKITSISQSTNSSSDREFVVLLGKLTNNLPDANISYDT